MKIAFRIYCKPLFYVVYCKEYRKLSGNLFIYNDFMRIPSVTRVGMIKLVQALLPVNWNIILMLFILQKHI
jgi:hypothetical protein